MPVGNGLTLYGKSSSQPPDPPLWASLSPQRSTQIALKPDLGSGAWLCITSVVGSGSSTRGTGHPGWESSESVVTDTSGDTKKPLLGSEGHCPRLGKETMWLSFGFSGQKMS